MKFVYGDAVRVTEGFYKGLEGIVVNHKTDFAFGVDEEDISHEYEVELQGNQKSCTPIILKWVDEEDLERYG